jgi:photosystem II stability/assembly factor-like uncharacterized protein
MRLNTIAAGILVATLSLVTATGSPRSSAHQQEAQQPAQGALERESARMWKVETSGVDSDLRGISIVAPVRGAAKTGIVIWASGSGGVILKSTDDGKTWQQIHIPDAGALDFRGIRAFGTGAVYVMSSGEGDKSRIYKTTDGGATWKMQFTDTRSTFFLDAIVCDGELKCAALSDPVDGKFVIVRTTDGETWQIASSEFMPAALKGEGAFAASNSAMVLMRGGSGAPRLSFATGGPGGARVFYSPDFGKSWTVTGTPLGGADSSGIFSIVRSFDAGAIVGGDYKKLDSTEKTAAYSTDRGATFQLSDTPPSGFRSAVIALNGKMLVAVGPNGSDFSDDGGRTWKRTDAVGLNAAESIMIGSGREAWGVGPGGAVMRLKPGPWSAGRATVR